MNRLIYRRQFILARQSLADLVAWDKFKIGSYTLHVHPDLQTTAAQESGRTVTLLGYLFDPDNYQSSNEEILGHVLATTKDYWSFILALKPYVGRYAVFYEDHDCLNLVQDALALREVYYCQTNNVVICGSQPNLLVQYSMPKISESTDRELLYFAKNHLPEIRNGRLWIGDGTIYDSVKHLLPNHYLDLKRMQSARYWPNVQLKRIEIDEAIMKCASFLRGALKAAAHRFPLMMAVTAGEDSRALLAASKEISNSIYYFINKIDRLNYQSPDIRIPQEMFKRLGIPFHIHEYSKKVPEEYKSIFLKNTFYAKEQLLPVIYNVYHKGHSEKVNILGVGEVGRTKFLNEPKNLTPYYLAYSLRYRRSRYATRECESWLVEARPIARQYDLNVMTLLWWEILIGNWGAVGNSESDIAMEEFDPYNSHFLYEAFLSVDPKYRTLRDNILFKEMIRYMWPQLLDLPFNPTDGLRDWLITVLHKLKIEYPMRILKARAFELCYRLFWARREPID